MLWFILCFVVYLGHELKIFPPLPLSCT